MDTIALLLRYVVPTRKFQGVAYAILQCTSRFLNLFQLLFKPFATFSTGQIVLYRSKDMAHTRCKEPSASGSNSLGTNHLVLPAANRGAALSRRHTWACDVMQGGVNGGTLRDGGR